MSGGEGQRLRRLLPGIPAMSEPGLAVFLREAQAFWPGAGPFVDERAARAAKRSGCPPMRANWPPTSPAAAVSEELSWLAGALAFTDAHDEYDRSLAEAGA